MTHALLTTCVAHAPRVWPRHRWTGCEEGVDDAWILSALHCLLVPCYRTFMVLCGYKPIGGQPASGDDAEPDLEGIVAAMEENVMAAIPDAMEENVMATVPNAGSDDQLGE
eukprot:2343216-Amphidinium_carterae.1